MKTDWSRFTSNQWGFTATEIAMLLTATSLLMISAPSAAQSQLRPPGSSLGGQATITPLQGSAPSAGQTQLRPPNPSVQTHVTTAPLQSPMQGMQQSNVASKTQPVVTLNRFKTVIIDNKVVDLRTLPDSTVLKGKSGRTITVARIKQLQARIDGASTASMIIAQKGQSLKTLAAAPAGTLVTLPGGQVTRSQDLAKIQTVFAKLSVKRVIKPIPISLRNATPTAVVGQGITLAEAMRRPGPEVIQIGTHKYTADQLRQMDTLLKASLREPRGLLERIGTKTARPGQAVRQGGVK